MSTHDEIDPSPDLRRCTAHSSRTGEPCKLPPVKGSNVCRSHGAAAPQVKAKARRRLEDAADRMARELLKMATDDNVGAGVKLAAIKDALDRAGVSARNAVDVEVGTRPFEQIFDAISSLTTESPPQRGFGNAAHESVHDSDPAAEVELKSSEPVIDIERFVPGADPSALPPKSHRKRSNSASHKTYTLSDF